MEEQIYDHKLKRKMTEEKEKYDFNVIKNKFVNQDDPGVYLTKE